MTSNPSNRWLLSFELLRLRSSFVVVVVVKLVPLPSKALIAESQMSTRSAFETLTEEVQARRASSYGIAAELTPHKSSGDLDDLESFDPVIFV